MRRMRTLRWLTLAVVASLGCGLETGTMLSILHAPAPNGRCGFDTTGVIQISSGFYDPTGQSGYILALTLMNHLASGDFDPIIIDGGASSLRADANRISLIGFETCFYRLEDPNLTVNSLNATGPALVDCRALPLAQQRFIPASTNLEPDEGVGIAVVEVLTHTDLQALYGTAFQPFNISVRGPYVEDTNGDGVQTTTAGSVDRVKYSYLSQSPGLAVRDADWGTFRTDSREDMVIVQLRARGKLQTGQLVYSQEFHYPIRLSVGTVDAACGDLIQEQCTSNCPGNQTCGANTDPYCIVGTAPTCYGTCPPTATTGGEFCQLYGFSGFRTSGGDRCLPYQGFSAMGCIQVNECLGIF